MKRRRAANDSAPAEWLSSPTWVGTIVGDDRDHVGHSDLARVRFAHSPVEELVASLRVLQDPGRQLMYGRWVSATRGRLGGLRLDLLAALAPTGRYLPAFLFPPSTRPWGVLAEELAQVAASPPAVVRAELDKVREGGPLPAVLGPLYDDPAGQLPAVVEEIGAVLGGGHRAGVAAGPGAVRRRPGPPDGAVRRRRPGPGAGRPAPRPRLRRRAAPGRQAPPLLPPLRPRRHRHRAGAVRLHLAEPEHRLLRRRPARLIYPPRGVAELWEDTMAEQPDPLSALVGRTRASLLAILAVPGTTQLAERLELSPAAVSQHLKILKDAALVSAHRRGRMVLYQRTPAATTLLEAIPSDQASSG
jgi:DNA-binding transcriptional ArsR family regulator